MLNGKTKQRVSQIRRYFGTQINDIKNERKYETKDTKNLKTTYGERKRKCTEVSGNISEMKKINTNIHLFLI